MSPAGGNEQTFFFHGSVVSLRRVSPGDARSAAFTVAHFCIIPGKEVSRRDEQVTAEVG